MYRDKLMFVEVYLLYILAFIALVLCDSWVGWVLLFLALVAREKIKTDKKEKIQ